MITLAELLICFLVTLILHFAEIYLFGKLSKKNFECKFTYFIIMTIFVIVQVALNIYNLQGIGTIVTIIYFYFMFQKNI